MQVRDNTTRTFFAELYVTKLEICILTCFEMAGFGRCSLLFGQIACQKRKF